MKHFIILLAMVVTLVSPAFAAPDHNLEAYAEGYFSYVWESVTEGKIQDNPTNRLEATRILLSRIDVSSVAATSPFDEDQIQKMLAESIINHIEAKDIIKLAIKCESPTGSYHVYSLSDPSKDPSFMEDAGDAIGKGWDSTKDYSKKAWTSIKRWMPWGADDDDAPTQRKSEPQDGTPGSYQKLSGTI